MGMLEDDLTEQADFTSTSKVTERISELMQLNKELEQRISELLQINNEFEQRMRDANRERDEANGKLDMLMKLIAAAVMPHWVKDY